MLSYKVTVRNPSGFISVPQDFYVAKRSNIIFCYISVRWRHSKCQKRIKCTGGLCVKSGDEITLICDGEDEQAAIDALASLIESGLGE